MSNNIKTLIVLSGGQDSVTCLGFALKEFKDVHAISFNYGQKHACELEAARSICNNHNVPFELVDIPCFTQFNDSALLACNESDVNELHSHKEGLPASFVPARNALFLTIAHAYAQKIGAEVITTGVCETDYSGYPDCRNIFIKAIEHALNVGYEANIQIYAPLMYLNKAQTFAVAEKYDFLDTVINETHTCYNGVRNHLHEWGYGCGKCPACELRKQGYNEFIKSKDEAK